MVDFSRVVVEKGVVVGEWWHEVGNGRIQCDLCPRYCKLRDGQRGFCFVRQALDGRIVLTSYGRASGFCIDPIEKKPLNHFYPGSAVLSFGTAGCNLGCRYCQNWSISKVKEMDRLGSWAFPESVVDAAVEHQCCSIAFTYNDPVIFAEYAIDCARAARARGVKTVAVTAGYIAPEARQAFFAQMDAANIDLKAFSEQFYSKLCFAHLEPVLETLCWVKAETAVWLELTTLLIPGQNDSEEEVARLCDWVAANLGPETPLHFSAFHPDFKMMDTPPTPARTLSRARQQAKAAGLQHVYTGNVHDRTGQSTYCAGCGTLLIERNWYQLGAWRLDENGRCQQCGTPLAGHYDSSPGDWGARRLPIRL
ncbi:MAG: AmmeMemoRadiSam system radical SAM enzyme [Anaerolineales bacterium]|nr:AmmeMemoRadiSam system radical SAM enzyme [Anaerolineales bacterium]